MLHINFKSIILCKGGECVSENIQSDTLKLILAVFVAIAGIAVKVITYNEKQEKKKG